jgi:FAD/FMN-containing dehydrogenase
MNNAGMTLTESSKTAGPAYAAYRAAVDRLRADLAAAPPDAAVRLGKRTSNLFRTRQRSGVTRLGVDAFSGVLAIDPQARTADVLGMTTYEDLVAATLPHGLMPLVVPQLKTITLGGAVTGLGIESTSFRHGLPHESVLEMDVLTGAGEVLCVRPQGEHRDLFYGFPNSYGTLGYALRLRIELQPVRPYVALTHHRFSSAAECFAAMQRLVEDDIDFLDGVAFSPEELYLTTGRFADTAARISDYTGEHIYYRSIQQRETDYLTIHDYLWRWDTDWFWCSGAFGVQRPLVRRLWPKRWLRSDVYWRLVALENRYGVKRRYDRLRGRPATEPVIQDVEIPVGRAGDFLAAFDRDVGMRPVWMCPLRQRDRSSTWDLYAMDPGALYVNFGFWGTVPLAPRQPADTHNRRVEALVGELGGRKSLYSTAHYTPEEFWPLYGGSTYGDLKRRYDPHGRLLDLYAKCVERR